MKIMKLIPLLGLCTCLAACEAPATEDLAVAQDAPPVVVDLRMREAPDQAYLPVREFTIPASHEIGDGMMPYEGIGWENQFVGYRMYLDGRLVSDIFGKQVSDPVLDQITEFGSYHALAPWGMDVLKVGPSLGLGGLGMIRDGEPAQFGTVPELSAKIDRSGEAEGKFTITAVGISAPQDETGGFTAQYAMGADSPITRVSVSASENLPLATGLVMHDGARLLRSEEQTGDWRYVATWGDTQSENKDGLGMAVFYRASQADYGGLGNATHFVTFNAPQFEYAFLAVWELDPSGVTSQAEFKSFLAAQLAALNGDAQ